MAFLSYIPLTLDENYKSGMLLDLTSCMLKLSQSIKVIYITMLTHSITLFFDVIIVFTVRNECSADWNQMPTIPELAQVCTYYVLNFRSVPMKTKTRKSPMLTDFTVLFLNHLNISWALSLPPPSTLTLCRICSNSLANLKI